MPSRFYSSFPSTEEFNSQAFTSTKPIQQSVVCDLRSFIFSKNNQYFLTGEGVINKTRHSRTSTQLVVVVNGLY